MKPLLRLLWVGLMVLGLAACAVTPPAAVDGVAPGWTGRLALSVQTDPPQSFSAGFELHGAADAGRIHLTSPFGQVLAAAHWSSTGAVLQRGDEVQVYASMDELTYALTGAALPLAHLFQWLQGEPTAIHGWKADLSRHGEGRISAQRSEPAPPAQLRIVLD